MVASELKTNQVDTTGEQSQSSIKKAVEKWSAQEVQTWLKESGFAKFVEMFEELDGKEMLMLTKEDLQNLTGNQAKGIVLFYTLQKLKQPGN